jgi:hypothetical protein
MWDASTTPAMNASSGHRWPSADAHSRFEVSIAPMITLAVWTLANTPPRAMYVWASRKPFARVSNSANQRLLVRSVSFGPVTGPPIRTT